jgi:hypothetical protein
MLFRMTTLGKAMMVAAGGAAVFAVSIDAADSVQIAQYIRDITAGPATYYTPEAYSYFVSRSPVPAGAASTDRDAAIRCFSAITRVSHLPSAEVQEVIPAIVTLFPKMVHLVQIREATFGAGEGNFDDCIGTYVTNAKNQFMVSPPILDYNSMSQYENFIEESHDVEFISKRLDASGQVIQAIFSLKIFFSVYIGEGALSRLTGQALGHDQSAWRQLSIGVAPQSAPAGRTGITSEGVAVQAAPDFPARISPGGTYRISLTTGISLEGRVLSKDNESLTVLTAEGKPYVIAFTLIKNCEPLEPSAPSLSTH